MRKAIKTPEYDYDALKIGVKKIDENIKILREGIRKEEKKKTEFQGYIEEWEKFFEESAKVG